MKQIIKFNLILILAVVFQHCSEQEDLRPEKVQFTCHLKSHGLTGGRISSLPDGSVLKISIQTLAGNPVVTNQTVNLLSFGESFITDPLELTPGTYKIVDFLIVHGTTVLYAVPRIGSPLANVVVNPLDFEFTVTKNSISTIDMEVINLNGLSPEDFGYTSFNIGIINTFELSVFTEANNQVNFTSAEGYILQDKDTIQKFTINPTVNRVAFPGDEEKTYTIEVIKDGYSRYTREFILHDLVSELNNRPLSVFLNPAFTLRAVTRNNSFQLNHIESLIEGELVINWGDGQSEPFHLQPQAVPRWHEYETDGTYFVSITGDLSKIEFIEITGASSQTKKINVENLPELKEIRAGITRGPSIVDLSHNTKLHSIELAGSGFLETLYLPDDHAIRHIMISGPNLLTTTDVDSIIDNIYTNAINKNTRNGFFGLKQVWHDNNNTALLGPPSAEGLAKLLTLRDTYEWVLYPNP